MTYYSLTKQFMEIKNSTNQLKYSVFTSHSQQLQTHPKFSPPPSLSLSLSLSTSEGGTIKTKRKYNLSYKIKLIKPEPKKKNVELI